MNHLLGYAALATICAGPSALMGQSTVPITELPTPSAASSPQGIDTAPGGSLWYCETAAGKIAHLKQDGPTTEFPLPNGTPFIAKVAADGIWFTYANRAAIGHLIQPRGRSSSS